MQIENKLVYILLVKWKSILELALLTLVYENKIATSNMIQTCCVRIQVTYLLVCSRSGIPFEQLEVTEQLLDKSM